MINLIVSLDSYSWIYNCAGLITRSEDSFDVIVVTKDNLTPIHNCKNLCEEAIYNQRVHDCVVAGKELKIRKLINLKHKSINSVDIEQLIVHLSLYTTLNNIKTVYIQNNFVLYRIFKAIKKNLPLNLFLCSETNSTDNILLTYNEYNSKCLVIDKMVGLPEKKYSSQLEAFCKVEI